MQSEQPHRIGRFLGIVLSLAFVTFSVWLFLNRQAVLDQYTVYRNPPTAEVVNAADKAGLNDNGKFMLYAAVPQVQDRTEFASSCSNLGEKSAVLGCYRAQRIYTLDVTDERLSGIEEVTLAHEMLHGAYERLSASDKKYVDGLLEKEYAANTNERLAGLVKIYDETEPGERYNELHSIYATEIATLSPELEKYYERYFTDRQKVIALFTSYYGVFDSLKSDQRNLVSELNDLAQKINTQITQYNQDADKLQQDIDAFNANADNYTSQSAFDRDRQALMNRQAALRGTREIIANSIATYDIKKKQLDELNIQAAELNQSINSNIDDAPSL